MSANDSYYYRQWGLKGSYGIDVEDAWEVTTGSHDIRVGVIDTGIETDHPDLVGNLVTGKSFVSGVTSTTDTFGHGTHVAGIIGAVSDNSMGISGVCKEVSLVPLRISTDDTWSTSNAVNAINYAKNLWGTTEQINVINLSGQNFPNSSSLKNAIGNYPGLFVTAAGNSNKNIDSSTNYPASFDVNNMIVVGSHTSSGDRSDFSNYGSKSVDIFAPGSSIYSTVPNKTYKYYDGTSMAAPFVTGVAALMLSVNPDLSAKELKASIMGNAKIPNVNGTNPLEGLCVSNGILDAYKAVCSVAMETYGTAVMGLREDVSKEVRHVSVPKMYNGITITALDVKAFNNYTTLESFYYDHSISIPSTVVDGCTSLKTVREEGGSSFSSGGLDTHWSSWREVAVLPILNYSDLYANGKTTLQLNYNAYFSVYGRVSYRFRVSDYNNKQYAISGTYNSGNGQNHTRNCILDIPDITAIPQYSQLRIQIQYMKQKPLWGGHFTMTGKYLQLNIA